MILIDVFTVKLTHIRLLLYFMVTSCELHNKSRSLFVFFTVLSHR